VRAFGKGLLGVQRLDFCEGEVAGKKTFVARTVDDGRAAARCKFRVIGHIGGVDDVGLVAGNQVAIFGGNQIGLDKVCAEFDGQRITFQRVFWQVSRCATVTDDQGLGRCVSSEALLVCHVR
jgi:hypothetical protein